MRREHHYFFSGTSSRSWKSRLCGSYILSFLLMGILWHSSKHQKQKYHKTFWREDGMETQPNPTQTKPKRKTFQIMPPQTAKISNPSHLSLPSHCLSHYHINPFHFHFHFQPLKNKNPRIHFSNLHTKNNLCLGIYLVNLVQILFLIIMRGKKTQPLEMLVPTTLYTYPLFLLGPWWVWISDLPRAFDLNL